ncbi:MAG: 23S rRNA (adenine(2503)-C(2))-methyltransferase RlmN [Saprospiraceae bacterium]|nr:23S rRNA (adenine(2503)-C(2))-methyltransferase RlmN [Saprospiraceae bacterium]
MKQAHPMLDIRLLTKEDLVVHLNKWEEPSYRANQIWSWLWQNPVYKFSDMTNLSQALRTRLAEQFDIRVIRADKIQRSTDGTIKTRFILHDDHYIEAVLIPVPGNKRFTVCVSSQVGCSLSCSFCATGKMIRMRNLDPGEIFDQVVMVNQQSLEEYGKPLTNIVFMGMGEPLLNYKNVAAAIAHITSTDGLAMSPRRITVSTAGIAKMIRRIADEGVRYNLALSLHAADDAKRNEIMPINEQNDLSSLQKALQYFYYKTRNKITLEYIAFNQFNDHASDAAKLAQFCKGFPVMINIIEYNPIEGANFVKSKEDRLDHFAKAIADKGIAITVRKSRGKDIDAACGQLANKD